MFFTPNLVVGLTIMSVGVVLMLDTLGIRDAGSLLKYWPGLIVLFGASLVAQAFRPVDPAAPTARRGSGGAPCFFLFLLGVAMFASFGFPGSAETRAGGPSVRVTGIMSNARSEPSGSDFRSGRVAAVMGRSSLDLRQVKLAPGETVDVDVFVAMGNATVRIPDNWVVDAGAMPVMGAVEQRRFTPLAPQVEAERGDQSPSAAAQQPAPGPAPRLRLRGFVMMGKVEVTS